MTKLRLALTRLFPASFRRAHGRELRAFIKDASADRTMSAPHLAGDLVVSVSLGLFLMAVLATWWPARRAARVNPMAALRQT